MEIFYEGFACVIAKDELRESYLSEVTLQIDRDFHFWQEDQYGDTWEECLFKTLEACQLCIAQYGFAPDLFAPVWEGRGLDPNDYF